MMIFRRLKRDREWMGFPTKFDSYTVEFRHRGKLVRRYSEQLPNTVHILKEDTFDFTVRLKVVDEDLGERHGD